MIENANVKAQRAWLQNEYDEGIMEGYNGALTPMPAWYFTHTLEKLTARQRGYWFGRETRIQDGEDHA